MATQAIQTVLLEVVTAERTRTAASVFRVRKLVRTMAAANPLWGAPRVHGELLKLGFEISERTVSRLMPKDRKSTQTWMTFLHNHVRQFVSTDFFTVATIRFRVLYVLIVLARDLQGG